MVPIETELKIPVRDLDSIRTQLEQSKGRRVREANRETNALFDTKSRTLMAKGHALRLRRVAGQAILTLKGPARYLGPIKRRTELEVEVGDAETLSAMLRMLGFEIAVRYEKDREVWSLGAVEVALDRTPMGDFVEIEGPPGTLPGVASELGLDLSSAVQGSYLSLWEQYRRDRPHLALPADMVFGS
jgi:adenylate cyclase class 2